MSWREVIIDSPCKVSVAGNYLILRGEELRKVHLSEISILMVSNTCVNITAVAIVELLKFKVKVVFCDETHNPSGEILSYYGCHNSSKKLLQQVNWDKDFALVSATQIIKNKIINQSKLLQKLGFFLRAEQLLKFSNEVELGDTTNREGHSAKVYFNTLFGLDFNRDISNTVNKALNYGYSILLSVVNREVVSSGCSTQLGIKHCNEYNFFNLSCDLVEPFRVIVDEFVYSHQNDVFDKTYKYALVDLLNKEILLDRKHTLLNAIKIYVKNVIDALNDKRNNIITEYNFE